jgi:DNA-directed RNA polymerase sigma subunit (sigma70/sigma32)
MDTMKRYYAEVNLLGQPSKELERQEFNELCALKRRMSTVSDPTIYKQLEREKIRRAQQLCCYYLRFVMLKAHARTKNKDLLADLISAGNLGLVTAVEKFDTAYSNRFLTYAAYWVSVKMDEVIHRLGVVHVSVHLRKKSSGRDEGPPSPVMTPAEDVPLASSSDVAKEARPEGEVALRYLVESGLTLRERLILIYALGLRGEPKSDKNISQLFYSMEGSVLLPEEIEQIRQGALGHLQMWLESRPDIDPWLELG